MGRRRPAGRKLKFSWNDWPTGMSGSETRRLLVFAKAPIPGQTKTRLIPALGAEGAAALHAQLCRRTLALAARCGIAEVELWCSPDANHPFFVECRQAYGVALKTQQGADLGERMAHALADALTARRYAVLIGTDCADRDEHDLQQAFDALARGHDAVLGPAADGGYVLIGLRAQAPDLFAAIDWGSEKVLAQTRRRLAELSCTWHELPMRHDVDRPADLVWLSDGDPAKTAPKTWPPIRIG